MSKQRSFFSRSLVAVLCASFFFFSFSFSAAALGGLILDRERETERSLGGQAKREAHWEAETEKKRLETVLSFALHYVALFPVSVSLFAAKLLWTVIVHGCLQQAGRPFHERGPAPAHRGRHRAQPLQAQNDERPSN